jgi:hypothetical protein
MKYMITNKISKGFFLFIILCAFRGQILAQEEINIVGNVSNILNGDMTPSLLDRTDFDFALVGGGSVTRTFIIENLGTSDLTVSSISGTGDFTTVGALTPTSPIPAGGRATFTVTFFPSAIGLRSATITILNSDTDEGTYEFAVQGTGVVSAVSSWDPLLYPPSPCSWTSQDNNTSNSPFASWNLAVEAAESAGNNAVITLQPDAYIGSFDYDGANGNESCLGHQVAATMDLNAAQNGMQILGSTNGCLTFIDLSSGSASDQWGNFSNMDGLTIKNIFLRQWGGAINLTNCNNILIEDCVFEDVNNSTVNAINISGCTNVIFRRCKFLGNDNPSGRAMNIINSGTAGSRILIEDCEFGCNSNLGSGAALMIGGGSFVEINGGIFSGNNAGAGGRGGAVNVQPGADVIFNNVNFVGNSSPASSSTDGGGAIFVDGSSTTLNTTVLINSCNFYQNTAAGLARGGAVVCIGNSSAVNRSNTTIQNSIFERNGADFGGAFLALNCTVNINNNIFRANQNAALSGNNTRGGALYFQNAAGSYRLTNNTFSGNLSSSGQAGRNFTGCGGCFTLIDCNDYTGQTEINLTNATVCNSGASIPFSSISAIAADYDCGVTGTYCSITLPTACLSNQQSPFICSPLAAVSACISGQVWNDLNGDGIQAAGDDGIANAFVLLYDEMGYLIGRTLTNASGIYSFCGLPTGNYTVIFVNPNLTFYTLASPANAPGSTESTDSDQASVTVISGELRGASSENIFLSAGNDVTDVDLGLTNVSVPLPVELIAFKAKCTPKGREISWTTATETGSKEFILERSAADMEFRSIVHVEAAGYSNDFKEYKLIDTELASGLNYYRLRQVDTDASIIYSNIIAIQSDCNSNVDLTLYPNPANAEITLQISLSDVAKVELELYNMLGQKLKVEHFGTLESSMHFLKLNIDDLQSGNYMLRIKIGEELRVMKFQKI